MGDSREERKILLTLINIIVIFVTIDLDTRRIMKVGRKSEKNERMIHIRLPGNVHKRLRVRAAELDVSIQRLVEEIIKKELGGKS